MPSTARGRRFRLIVSMAALATVVLGSGFAVYDSFATLRAQRRTAERTIEDYTRFAAYLYSVRAYLAARDRINAAMAPLGDNHGLPRDRLPPVTRLAARPDTAEACGPPGEWSGYRFRMDLPARRIAFAGSAPSASTVTLLRDSLPVVAERRVARLWEFGYFFFGDPAHRDAVAFQPTFDSAKHIIAIYGYRSCYLIRDTADVAHLHQVVRVVPIRMMDSLPTDSVLWLRVDDESGRTLYAAPAHGTMAPIRESVWLGALGGTRWTVSLRPAIANGLILGGLPQSRVPASAVLLTLSIALAIAAFLLFRRELQLVNLRETFVTNVSHELRTPLQQILIFVQLLRMGWTRSEEERASSLEIIETETHRLIALADNVLSFERDRRAPLTLAPVDVNAALCETAAHFAPLASARHVQIDVRAPDVPVLANANALRQVLVNLLDNAVKYGPSGKTVVLSARSTSDGVEITVDDAGPGIPAEDRERVWEPYTRLARAEEGATGGAGIGLAIVRRLTERMGGRASISQSPEGGTRATVYLRRYMAEVI